MTDAFNEPVTNPHSHERSVQSFLTKESKQCLEWKCMTISAARETEEKADFVTPVEVPEDDAAVTLFQNP